MKLKKSAINGFVINVRKVSIKILRNLLKTVINFLIFRDEYH